MQIAAATPKGTYLLVMVFSSSSDWVNCGSFKLICPARVRHKSYLSLRQSQASLTIEEGARCRHLSRCEHSWLSGFLDQQLGHFMMVTLEEFLEPCNLLGSLLPCSISPLFICFISRFDCFVDLCIRGNRCIPKGLFGSWINSMIFLFGTAQL